ncbi:PilW family protein [Deinococcus sp. AJ005]|uniref:PilW family protein n=1 Tax=Deinococcus sp. AJ005 TaxID=2652443 RepID=UPI00125CB625|nr:prepilin-type N-terminal cleavage/methylation domain-containing protein [Deinococcus sp. AJ005]QFP75939.1 prepilin-type N-terminal cleavage/methylation domain-containing protein [Deinococcus sp. AJ005]
MKRRATTQGLTLIELLVAIALGLLVLLAATNLLISSSRSATDVQGRSELLEESQIAQNYMAAQIREAVYVFPAGTTITLGATGYTFKNPVTSNGTWVVGQADAPIVAFVRPPQLLPAGANTCASDVKYCYQFFAYYPVRRSVWTGSGGATSLNNPGIDTSNTDRWVLVEYRSNYASAPALSSLNVSGYSAASGSSGRLLLDYVQPQALALANTPPLFEVITPPAGTLQAPGNTSVTINLAVSRQTRGRAVTVPPRNATTTGPQSVTPLVVTPRNVGNLSP